MRNRQATQLLFELSRPGRRSVELPASDVPDVAIDQLVPGDALAELDRTVEAGLFDF